MKKTILIGIAIMFCLFIPFASSALVDEYSTGNDTSNCFHPTEWSGQSFTATESYAPIAIELLTYKQGTGGTYTYGIRETNPATGYPTGASLCTGTVDAGTFTTATTGLWYNVTLTGCPTLTMGTKYAIVNGGGVDGSNRMCWKSDNTVPTYTGGIKLSSVDSGVTWVNQTGRDFLFRTYKQPNLLITSRNAITNISLTNFTVNITKQPSTYIGEYNDTAGTISTSILTSNSSLFNITVYKSGYMTRIYENKTVTANLVSYLYPMDTFTFNFYNEQTNNRLTENISVDMGIVGINYGENYNIHITNWTYTLDLIIPDLYWINYNITGYEMNNYYSILDGNYTNIRLYAMPTSATPSTLQLNLLDSQNYDNYQDVITKLQRYYVGNASWVTVQMDRSDEYGNVFFKIIEETQNYRFIFTDLTGNILDTTTTVKFLCTSGVCQQTAVVSPITISTTTDVEFWQTIESNKENGSLFWNNVKGNNMNVNLTIKDMAYGNGSNICSATQYGSSGSLPCNVSAYTGYIRLDGYVEGDRYYTYYIRGAVSDLYISLGKEDAGLYTLIIVITIMMGGLMMGALAGIALTILALIFLEFIGMFAPFTLPFIISAGVIASLIGYKIYKR